MDKEDFRFRLSNIKIGALKKSDLFLWEKGKMGKREIEFVIL
jgi:hypothetical protein